MYICVSVCVKVCNECVSGWGGVIVITLSMMASASFPAKQGKGEWVARVLRFERIVSTLARRARKPAKGKE